MKTFEKSIYEQQIKKVLKVGHHKARDIKVEVKDVKFSKTLSAPYAVHDPFDMVSDHIERTVFTVECTIDYRYNPHVTK